MQTLKICSDKRRIITEDGSRFYFIGDTAWELFHALDRDEAELYLRTRAEQGFNMIQAVVLAELDGLRTPNAYGRVPLTVDKTGNFDPLNPDLSGEYNYFDHVEYILTLAEELGLYIGLLPTWGDKFNKQWGVGPEIFTPENAYGYAKWLAERVVHHNNIFWILGGDRPLTEDIHYMIIDSMAEGLKAGDRGKFLMTFHPCGAQSSSAYVHGRSWLDFHMMQSGHGFPSPHCFDMMAADYTRDDYIPVMDGEPCYEDHAINFNAANGYYDAYNVRLAAFRNLFGGACGNTYGHSSVWQMRRYADTYSPNTWQTALHRPAAESIHIYRDFICDNDLTKHIPIYDIVENNTHDANYVAGMISESSAYLYIPCCTPVKLNKSVIPFDIKNIKLFFPASGEYANGPIHLNDDGLLTFPGHGGGRGMDVVVILS